MWYSKSEVQIGRFHSHINAHQIDNKIFSKCPGHNASKIAPILVEIRGIETGSKMLPAILSESLKMSRIFEVVLDKLG